MIGRPRQFDETIALTAAMQLFWQQGYTVTSLDDLLQVMSISKSSFYAEFRSKEALFRRCLHAYRERTVERLQGLLAQSDGGLEFLKSVFAEVINDATSEHPRGCLIVNSAVEFGQHTSEFSEDVEQALRSIQRVFETAIDGAARNQEIKSTASPAVLAGYITTCISGLRSMIKGGISKREAGAIARQILASISP